MNLTITKIYRNTKDKDGNPLQFKDRSTGAMKSYEKVAIQAREYGEKYLSAFGAPWNMDWKSGDTIDVEIEQKGEYLNLKRADPIKAIKEDIKKILSIVESIAKGTNSTEPVKSPATVNSEDTSTPTGEGLPF